MTSARMWRFYALATAIVLVFGGIFFGHRISTGDWDVRAQPTGTPTITQGNGERPGTPHGAFVGDGPWVLSALPDCFEQQSSITGTPLALAFDVPPERERIPAGTVLRSGPCTIGVRAHDVLIARGADRLRVPHEAHLYRTPKGLVLVFIQGTRAEIRVYRPHK
jgi:hypothetical protein